MPHSPPYQRRSSRRTPARTKRHTELRRYAHIGIEAYVNRPTRQRLPDEQRRAGGTHIQQDGMRVSASQ